MPRIVLILLCLGPLAGVCGGQEDSLRSAVALNMQRYGQTDSAVYLYRAFAGAEAVHEWQLRNAVRVPGESVGSVQCDMLREKETLLEYLIVDSSLFIFAIGKDTFLAKNVPLDFPLSDWVGQMQEGIYGYFYDPAPSDTLFQVGLKQYGTAAHSLYQKLIVPVAPCLSEKVFIVPDGVLCTLAFDALLSEPPPMGKGRYGDYAYAARRYNFRFAYSAGQARRMSEKQHDREPAIRMLTFVPLPGGTGETTFRARRTPDGKALYGPSASKENFLQMAGSVRILHLVTQFRAQCDGDTLVLFSPKPGFSDDAILRKKELAGLALNADIVGFSACSTGTGAVWTNEGLPALTAAFADAGAKSTLAPLWPAGDRRTNDLISNFYSNLAKRQPKDEALYRAKIHYLNANKGKFSLPFFWAGWVLAGDPAAIEK